MAKIDLKFIDCVENTSFIKADSAPKEYDSMGTMKEDFIVVSGYDNHFGEEFSIWLDKSTAIKFAKTLRTHINEIKKELSDEN